MTENKQETLNNIKELLENSHYMLDLITELFNFLCKYKTRYYGLINLDYLEAKLDVRMHVLNDNMRRLWNYVPELKEVAKKA